MINMIELSGKEYRNKYLPILKEKVSKLDRKLGLVVIQVGNDEASNVYVEQKGKRALELGYNFEHKKFEENASEEDVIKYIEEKNNDDMTDGIIVQLPLPSHLNSSKIVNAITPLKDVDGLTYYNAGHLMANEVALLPCTPKGIIALLDEYNIELEGKNVVVIGRSLLVGKPVANLFINRNATVTLCHSKTKDVGMYTRNADIVVVAIGKAHFLKEDMVKDDAVVIDVGISRIDGNYSSVVGLPVDRIYTILKENDVFDEI